MKKVARIKWITIASLALVLLYISQSCTREKIIVYGQFTQPVVLAEPANSGSIFVTMPNLIWHSLDEAILYQVQMAKSAMFDELVFSETLTDTFYVYESNLSNGQYFWRVRAKDNNDIWSDWSEAMVWSFFINNNSLYMNLLSVVPTIGVAQDIFVVEEQPDSVIAYVADGQAGLMIVNVTDPSAPVVIGSVDTYNGDFASSVWKLPGDEIAYVADMDGKIATIDTHLPLDPYSMRNVNLGWDQNLQDLTGMVLQDTIYLFTANSNFGRRKVNFFQIVYRDGIPGFGDLYVVPAFILPADVLGIFYDSIPIVVEYYSAERESTFYETQTGLFVFAAVSQAGLWWYDFSTTHSFDGADTMLIYSPRCLGWADTPGSAISVFARDGFAYVADDRGGLQIFDLPDTIPAFDHDDLYEAVPELVSNINTSGRTKDVHIVGNYCYLADGSGGLKIIDVTDPYAPVFLAAYTTPYAYGVWADENYVYIADRDNGLMIFANGELIN
jgi:hypothetical protein